MFSNLIINHITIIIVNNLYQKWWNSTDAASTANFSSRDEEKNHKLA